MLACITCHYNPLGYRRPVENLIEFRSKLGNVPLYIAELSFDNSFWIEDSVKISGTSANLMWQKERLLNYLIEHLPPKYDSVAWIDADVIFDNPDWYKETKQRLRHSPVLQMFKTITYGNPDGSNGEVYRSVPYEVELKGDLAKYNFRPGFAWAARREAIPNNLYDVSVIGNGDIWMFYTWMGMWHGGITKLYSVNHRRHWLDWSVETFRKVRKNVSYIDGNIKHLWHGSIANRRYYERNSLLTKYDFNPLVDIRIGNNGLYEWATPKHEMHSKIAEYFLVRREDGYAEHQQ